jgi:hypothetical protein
LASFRIAAKSAHSKRFKRYSSLTTQQLASKLKAQWAIELQIQTMVKIDLSSL